MDADKKTSEMKSKPGRETDTRKKAIKKNQIMKSTNKQTNIQKTYL